MWLKHEANFDWAKQLNKQTLPRVIQAQKLFE